MRDKMNNKGFTLVELLAMIVILGIIMGIAFVSVNGGFKNAKDKTEDVFVDTIKDAMDMYLTSSEAKRLNFSKCSNTINKKHGNINVYKAVINFNDVINSEYHPITQDDLVNPANDDASCNNAGNIVVNIYRDDDYVYYYSIDKDSFGCLKNTGMISNLPEGFEC